MSTCHCLQLHRFGSEILPKGRSRPKMYVLISSNMLASLAMDCGDPKLEGTLKMNGDDSEREIGRIIRHTG